MNVQARAAMSRRVRIVDPDTTCLTVWEYLSRTGADVVAVVDRAGRVHGVVSRSDIALAWLAFPKNWLQLRVLDLLIGRLRPRINPDTPISRAAKIMVDSRRDALPVLDADGTLIGALTYRDVLAAVARSAEHRVRAQTPDTAAAHLVG